MSTPSNILQKKPYSRFGGGQTPVNAYTKTVTWFEDPFITKSKEQSPSKISQQKFGPKTLNRKNMATTLLQDTRGKFKLEMMMPRTKSFQDNLLNITDAFQYRVESLLEEGDYNLDITRDVDIKKKSETTGSLLTFPNVCTPKRNSAAYIKSQLKLRRKSDISIWSGGIPELDRKTVFWTYEYILKPINADTSVISQNESLINIQIKEIESSKQRSHIATLRSEASPTSNPRKTLQQQKSKQENFIGNETRKDFVDDRSPSSSKHNLRNQLYSFPIPLGDESVDKDNIKFAEPQEKAENFLKHWGTLANPIDQRLKYKLDVGDTIFLDSIRPDSKSKLGEILKQDKPRNSFFGEQKTNVPFLPWKYLKEKHKRSLSRSPKNADTTVTLHFKDKDLSIINKTKSPDNANSSHDGSRKPKPERSMSKKIKREPKAREKSNLSEAVEDNIIKHNTKEAKDVNKKKIEEILLSNKTKVLLKLQKKLVTKIYDPEVIMQRHPLNKSISNDIRRPHVKIPSPPKDRKMLQLKNCVTNEMLFLPKLTSTSTTRPRHQHKSSLDEHFLKQSSEQFRANRIGSALDVRGDGVSVELQSPPKQEKIDKAKKEKRVFFRPRIANTKQLINSYASNL